MKQWESETRDYHQKLKAQVASRTVELVTCGFELLTRGFELLTRGFELAPHGFELVSCGFKLVTREFALIDLNSHFWISTRDFKLSTHNS